MTRALTHARIFCELRRIFPSPFDPGCDSKYRLVKLSNHLAQVHELSPNERKYWLQFAKLQTTNMIRNR